MWEKISFKNWDIIYKKNEDFIDTLNHSHFDFLSFILFHKNSPILIDCGRGSYYKSNVHYDAYMPKYHNTITLDELSYKPYHYNRYPKEYYTHCCYTKKIINDSSVNIEMTTDGFKRIDSSLKYKRIISITDNFFKVTDCFSANNTHSLKNFFHFHNSFKVELYNDYIELSNRNSRYKFSNNTKNLKVITKNEMNNNSNTYGTVTKHPVFISTNNTISTNITHKVEKL